MKNLTNKKFSRLLAIERVFKPQSKATYWKCLCDCGNYCEVEAFRLQNSTQSCGCLLKEVLVHRNSKLLGIPKLPNFESKVNSKIKGYRWSAKNRNFDWNLAKDLCIILFNGDCRYCGSKADPPKFNGIDRVDNRVGCIESNVVSCCTFCNIAKNDLDLDTFKIKINEIIKQKETDNLLYRNSDDYRDFYFEKLEENY